MTAIYKRELKSYFTTFLGPLFIGATLFLLGIYFSVYNLFMGYPYIGYALSSVVFLFLVSVPVLTMRILAEERRQKTDQLILTSPVGVGRIVLGKFLALATVFAIPVMIISLYPLVLAGFGTIAFGETYLAILGFFLYGLASIAIGIFVSSLTESQVIAAVLTFGILFLGYVMSGLCNMISPTGNFLTKILGAFDMAGRFEGLLDGSLQMTDIVYFLSVILLSLVFTVQSIQKRRYQISTGTVSMGAYSTAVLVISAGAVVLLALMAMSSAQRDSVKNHKLLFRKRYMPYYMVTLAYGCQKRIRIVFAPWVIINLLGQGADTVALLTIVTHFAGTLAAPVIGRMLDKLGVKKMLWIEAAYIAATFSVMGLLAGMLAGGAFDLGSALTWLVFGAYVLCILFEQFNMVHSFMMRSIALDPGEVTRTLSVGLSVDHVMAIIASPVMGVIWHAWGVQYVFYLAALSAVFQVAAAAMTRKV